MNAISKFFLIILFSLSANAYAATLNVEDGKYSSISNIDVNGTLYTATFYDGTYNNALAEYGSEQLNYTDVEALDFAGALYDFLNTSTSYDFGTYFNGCTGLNCYLSTVIENNPLTVWSVYVLNSSLVTPTSYSNHAYLNNDFGTVSNVIWEEVSVSAVPIPAAAFLFGPALLGFIGFRRKVKAMA